ncbi:CRISP-associated protein Cas1 [Pelagirhabdus alkalitolerans]|uniref:CRISPR-associated endonuclease Cas1 n=1 Tax=Pelagirhabdus alkalitolerans TaxID=1612202 RepID=A0A1G6KJ60_9BACI|nr:type II CRISPR-associated endonuclease Cas1 [Pelagirhabdus alkalitolerans]SDC30967.1 CRISP-associated protein Cas1 [Pelagirhabdus alkalitolerans]
MGWRIIHVNQVDQLSLQLDNLRVRRSDDDVRVPLKDIFAIVIEDLTCKLTSRLMIEMSKHNILVVLCNQKYLPECVVQPVSGHATHHQQMMRQLAWQEETKDKLWQQIIHRKLINQSIVMQRVSVDFDRIKKVRDLADVITPGDKENMEGQAARVYFNSFFESDYSRSDDTFIENAALNYGYSILHSAIARTVVAKGLISGLGIHHKGARNPHNLASDIIEPFRQIVDYYVLRFPPEEYLTKQYRLNLINLLHAKVEINQKIQTVIRAIELTIDSILEFFETGDSNKLKLPSINNLRIYES